MAILAFTGCASKPPAAHKWHVAAKIDHIPMQGLPAQARTEAHGQPTVLANFSDEPEREAKRQSAIGGGALYGATYGGIGAMAQMAPLCIVLPPLCIGVMAVGGAMGASQSAVSSVPQQDADRLAAIVVSHVTNDKLKTLSSHRGSGPEESRDYPLLVLRVSGVMLLPTRDGVTFRVAATAQGSPAAGQEWEPSVHFTQLPSRPVAQWLESDGLILKTDLDMALRVLADSIVPMYVPYEERGRR
jgi:hypothetical protein